MKMKLIFSVLYLYFFISVSYGASITTITLNDSFVLMNPRNEVATDIQIGLPPPAGGQEIGGGSGGSAFDRTNLVPLQFIRFFVGSGVNAGTGVAGNASITLNIMDFNIGTNFTVDFSYDIEGTINKEFEDAILVTQGVFDPQFPQGPLGEDLLVEAVPEPQPLFLVILGLVGIGLNRGKKIFSSLGGKMKTHTVNHSG